MVSSPRVRRAGPGHPDPDRLRGPLYAGDRRCGNSNRRQPWCPARCPGWLCREVDRHRHHADGRRHAGVSEHSASPGYCRRARDRPYKSHHRHGSVRHPPVRTTHPRDLPLPPRGGVCPGRHRQRGRCPKNHPFATCCRTPWRLSSCKRATRRLRSSWPPPGSVFSVSACSLPRPSGGQCCLEAATCCASLLM